MGKYISRWESKPRESLPNGWIHCSERFYGLTLMEQFLWIIRSSIRAKENIARSGRTDCETYLASHFSLARDGVSRMTWGSLRGRRSTRFEREETTGGRGSRGF